MSVMFDNREHINSKTAHGMDDHIRDTYKHSTHAQHICTAHRQAALYIYIYIIDIYIYYIYIYIYEMNQSCYLLHVVRFIDLMKTIGTRKAGVEAGTQQNAIGYKTKSLY